MCAMAERDGIEKIVWTPHLFRLNRYEDNLAVVEERMAEFVERRRDMSLGVFRGAEVFLHHNIVDYLKRDNLSINASDYVFIEFPSDHIFTGVRDLIFDIMLEGFTPIISHPERNSVFMERPQLLFELIEAGCLGQVTAMSLTGNFGSTTKKTALMFLKNNLVHIIASDAHNASGRPPVLSRGVEEAKGVVGEDKALAMVTTIPQAILDNKTIPDYGDPINPVKKKKWNIRLPKFQ